MYLASLLSDSESTQKINQNHYKNCKYQQIDFFSRPVEMFNHPADRQMELKKPVVYWVNQ